MIMSEPETESFYAESTDMSVNGDVCRLNAKYWMSYFDDTGIGAVVGTDDKLYIVDGNTGRISACLGDYWGGPKGATDGCSVNKQNYLKISSINGYICCMISSPYASDCYVVYDSKGNQIYGPDDDIYSQISKSGYCIKKVVTESLGGTTFTYNVIDSEGNIVHSIGPTRYINLMDSYLGDDLFALIKPDEQDDRKTETYFFDAASGNIYSGDSIDGYHSDDLFYYGGTYISGNYNHSQEKFVLNSNYLLEKRNNCIYDFQGNMVKDLNEGGVKQALYMDGVYYVESKTGFLYTLDDNFEYIAEPRKSNLKLSGITKAGVILMPESYDSESFTIKLADKNLDCTDLPLRYGRCSSVMNNYIMFEMYKEDCLDFIKLSD